MIGIEVLLKHAEKAKKHLLDSNNLNTNYKPIKKKTSIVFPVMEKDPNYDVVDADFNKTQKTINHEITTELDIPSSYDVIGDIVILEISDDLLLKQTQIGQAILKTHKNIKSVYKKSGIHEGEFRTQSLELLAGKKKTLTTYKEHEIKIKLDVAKVYFSPRLSTERKRIFSLVKKDEKILVMFSGVGVYPLVISKNTEAKSVIGIELNKIAHDFALENKVINKTSNVEFVCGDVNKVIPKLKKKFDRIVMPLPKDADKFLNLILPVAKKKTIVHLYGFSHRDNLKESESQVKEYFKDKAKIIKTVKCGQFSPCKYRVCVDFEVHAH